MSNPTMMTSTTDTIHVVYDNYKTHCGASVGLKWKIVNSSDALESHLCYVCSWSGFIENFNKFIKICDVCGEQVGSSRPPWSSPRNHNHYRIVEKEE